ncbi:MAG: DUF4212 domain-containing protein [Gammaproteobacteria bacterium]
MSEHHDHTSDRNDTTSPNQDSTYWAANLRLIKISLFFWFLVSFGFGILLRPLLADIQFGGTDLGFWFAQQGSILCFLVIIFFYSARMNKIDHTHGMNEQIKNKK